MTGTENTQPGSAATDLHSTTAAVRAVEAAVRVLDSQREAMAKTVEEVRLDVRDMRDRMARVETKLDALPSKLWIAGIVAAGTSFLAVVIGLLTLAGHLLGR